MKKAKSVSFRQRLFAAFVTVSLIPLLLCSASLVQVARLRLEQEAQTESRKSLERLVCEFDKVYTGILAAARTMQEDPLLIGSLLGEEVPDTQIYDRMFSLTNGLREEARFDLYDRQGLLLYSTERFAAQQHLPTNWGILCLGAPAGENAAFACGENEDGVLLQICVTLPDDTGEPAGYLVAGMTRANFARMFGGQYGTQSELMVLSRFWRPVYATQGAIPQALAENVRERLLRGQGLSDLSDSETYHVIRHEPSGVTLLLESPHALSKQTLRLLYVVSVSCAVICVALSVFLSYRFSRRLFQPVERLQKAIGEVEQNNLDVYVHPAPNDELGQLADHFNSMVCALKRNQAELVENQRQLNEAQIRMLQAQLNPHFLCNTLDTMKWISKINQVPQVAIMSTDLADILRYSISPEEFVPLRRDAKILERYVEIQRLRLSDAFSFTYDIPEALETCLVPKMMLQPIVENAILHGLDGVQGGQIRLTARAAGQTLRVSICDNGRGLPPDMLGAYHGSPGSRESHHLGLYNVHTILQKYYGSGYGLYLSNREEGTGAVVTATLPLKQEETIC